MLLPVSLKVDQVLVVIQLEKTDLEVLFGGPRISGFLH